MNTISNQALQKAFPPTKSIINVSRFMRNEGWLTNGFFAIREQLEPKVSRDYRFKDSEVKAQSLVDKTATKLAQYQEAEIANEIRLSFDREFLVLLKAESGRTAWCNPRYISYVLQGLRFFQKMRIMIGENVNDPIAFIDEQDQILALVMGFRVTEE